MNLVELRTDKEPATVSIRHVFRVYDKYRTSLLNVKYYGHKLIWARRINLYMEIAIAISAAGGVSGWAIWGKEGGALVWSIIAGASALLATIKPLLPLSNNIATYAKLYGGHNCNYLALKDLVERIAVERAWTKEMEDEFAHISKQHREMALDDDPKPSKRLVEKFTKQVNSQIPANNLWCPANA